MPTALFILNAVEVDVEVQIRLCKAARCQQQTYVLCDPTCIIFDPACEVPFPQHIGDGICNDWGSHNTAECGWDGGDCSLYDSLIDCQVEFPSQIVRRQWNTAGTTHPESEPARPSYVARDAMNAERPRERRVAGHHFMFWQFNVQHETAEPDRADIYQSTTCTTCTSIYRYM